MSNLLELQTRFYALVTRAESENGCSMRLMFDRRHGGCNNAAPPTHIEFAMTFQARWQSTRIATIALVALTVFLSVCPTLAVVKKAIDNGEERAAEVRVQLDKEVSWQPKVPTMSTSLTV